jgi:hypothetical protein
MQPNYDAIFYSHHEIYYPYANRTHEDYYTVSNGGAHERTISHVHRNERYSIHTPYWRMHQLRK